MPSNSWGLFGSDDGRGTLNFLDRDALIRAARSVRKGVVFRLDLPTAALSPALSGRGSPQHTVISKYDGLVADDYLDGYWLQGGSHWDALRHMRHPEHGFYNATPESNVVTGERLGVDALGGQGIAGRGVLLDIERYCGSSGQAYDPTTAAVITPALLEECAESQAVALEPGDILLVRTGWLTWYLERADAAQRELLGVDKMASSCPGLGPADEVIAYLWDHKVAAVAADNIGVEPVPGTGQLHFAGIPLFGLILGELWYLDDLARDCAEDGVYHFLLTSSPMRLPGGTGSPANAMALK